LWILFSGLEGPTLCISAEKKTWRASTCAIAINTWEWDFLFAKISRRKLFLDSSKPNDRSSNWQRVGFEINDSRHFGFDFGLCLFETLLGISNRNCWGGGGRNQDTIKLNFFFVNVPLNILQF
jgi:hypothetical protein